MLLLLYVVNNSFFLLTFSCLVFFSFFLSLSQSAPKASYLYHLLRPELVKRNPVPLSSDGYSRFGSHNADAHNKEILKATQRLHEKIIPSFATWLDNQDDKKLKGLKLTQLMHREGINVRHVCAQHTFLLPPHYYHYTCTYDVHITSSHTHICTIRLTSYIFILHIRHASTLIWHCTFY